MLTLKTPTEMAVALAQQAKALRLLKGWTRATMAARAGVTASSLKRFEQTGKASVELVLKVASTCKTLKVDKLLIENKAAGHSVAQEVRRLFSHENWMVQLWDPKGQDKMARLYSVQHLFAEGMVYAPDRPWVEQVIAQVGTFPRGKNDDLVDTVSMGLRHLRDLGLLTRQPEWASEVQESMRHIGAPPPPLYTS